MTYLEERRINDSVRQFLHTLNTGQDTKDRNHRFSPSHITSEHKAIFHIEINSPPISPKASTSFLGTGKTVTSQQILDRKENSFLLEFDTQTHFE